MPRAKTVGYIVESPKRGLMVYAENWSRTGRALYFGVSVTLFKSRDDAKRAIRETLKERPRIEAEFGVLQIRRVTETEVK